jgi:hypothetical protein
MSRGLRDGWTMERPPVLVSAIKSRGERERRLPTSLRRGKEEGRRLVAATAGVVVLAASCHCNGGGIVPGALPSQLLLLKLLKGVAVSSGGIQVAEATLPLPPHLQHPIRSHQKHAFSTGSLGAFLLNVPVRKGDDGSNTATPHPDWLMSRRRRTGVLLNVTEWRRIMRASYSSE